MAGGYVCFVVSIAGIGLLTAIIGDVASHFGCTVGFPDAVTAVTFVALGTSVPGKPPPTKAERSPIWHRLVSSLVTIVPAGSDGSGLQDRENSLVDNVTSSSLHPVRSLAPALDYCHGWVAFWVSILWIGFMTAIIGDVSSHLGCSVGLLDSCTALSIVALGTSLPDTFASKVAALNDKYADASVGNVTGSNAVNVFLGIGIAWTLAALHHWWHGEKFLVDPGNLAFNVTIFCVGALISIFVMMVRRMRCVGGELGGPKVFKYMTTGLLLMLWFTYITLACLEAYDVIEGF
ncbi:hypothetical protein FOCC_FOCC001823 [Frankliniella occidentalis]|nr:hypothetical protein FOCC_FOCC001823 [Frankliniella occidentalis]